MEQHRQSLTPGFTTKYGVYNLVYHEAHESMENAIKREKQIKKWNRLWKLRIIEEMNPAWADLYDPATGQIADCLGDDQDDEQGF